MRTWLRQGGWLLAAAALISGGCKEDTGEVILPPEQKPDYGRELGPNEVALRPYNGPPIDFSEGYERRANLEQAAMYSLEYMTKPSSRQYYPYLDITHERATASIQAFIDTLRSARSGDEFSRMVNDRFQIYESRGWNDQGIVLFTGYYRPIFDARLKPDSEYRYAVYKRPPDLVTNPGTGRSARYHLTRGDIARGALAGKGLELAYLRDPFEAYIMTVQGSGRLRLADGSYFDVGYAGDNGYEYTSIGQKLVEAERITRSDLSLQGLIRYFREHPEEVEPVLSSNERYVFFTPRTGGPYGSLNVPVTPFRTIATDKQVYPRASVAFMNTQVPYPDGSGAIRNHAYQGFAMDQDTGGAIRAAGRCDIFMGTGPEVGELAGRTLAEGRLYYLFLKSDAPGSAALASPMPEPQPIQDPTP